MSTLQKLIAQLCPEGVEYKNLKDKSVSIMKRGTSVTKKDITVGDIPVISGGKEPAYYCNKYNRAGGVITVAGSGAGAGYVQYWDTPIFVCDAFSIKGAESVDTKYLYYCLANMQAYIYSTKKGSGVPHVHISSIDKIKIPIPPLPIQQEIVRILDTFTALIEVLTAELAARKKQYAYYRDKLLTFGDDVPIVALGEVTQYSRGRISASELNADTYVGVDNLLPDKRGRTESSYVPENGMCTKYQEGDILIGNIRPYLKKIWRATNTGGANGDVLVIHLTDKRIISKYLYQLLCSDNFFVYDMQHAKGAKMPRGSKDAVMQYKIPLPPLAEQQRIVAILDRFDTLVHDLTNGLPAEIEARRKQYAYYRDKLLTFQEARG